MVGDVGKINYRVSIMLKKHFYTFHNAVLHTITSTLKHPPSSP